MNQFYLHKKFYSRGIVERKNNARAEKECVWEVIIFAIYKFRPG